MKKKIVIVEDDRLLGTVLKKMASALGFDVLDIARTGESAISSIKENEPDLVFMDIFLADDVSGIEAMKSVREYSNVPVIYISAQSDLQIQKEASFLGNSRFMVKPVNMSDLKMAVNGISSAA
ncbi:MAG: response regulator [Balneolaceae bacterium]